MGRLTDGYIKIHYSLFESDIAKRGNFTLGVFVRLICLANSKEGTALFNGKRITLFPGQLITGLRELSPQVDEDPHLNKVRAALDFLEARQTIDQVTGNKGRLITLKHWDWYQNGPQATPQAEHNQNPVNAQVNHNQTSLVTPSNIAAIRDETDTDHKLSTIKTASSYKQTTNELQLIKTIGLSLCEITAESKAALPEASLQSTQKDPRRVTAEEIDQCTLIWGETLQKFKTGKDPRIDRPEIARLIQTYGCERTKLALLGTGFEEKTESYDPGLHIGLYRFEKHGNFERFENLGAREKTRREKRELAEARKPTQPFAAPVQPGEISLAATDRERVRAIMATAFPSMPRESGS